MYICTCYTIYLYVQYTIAILMPLSHTQLSFYMYTKGIAYVTLFGDPSACERAKVEVRILLACHVSASTV